jgi:hypothetical protein
LVVFTGTQFNGEVQCDNQFVAALQRIDNYAYNHNVKLNVTDSYHPLNRPVIGAIVRRVSNSNHIAGHAIDANIIYQGKSYTSDAYLTAHEFDPSKFDKLPQSVKDFINDIKNDSLRAPNDLKLRWGGVWKGKDCDPLHIDDGLNVTDPATYRERVKALRMANPLGPKRKPLKNVAKVAKHGWKFNIAVTLLTLMIVINTVYYFGVFKMNPLLQPPQQIMDQIWSAPLLAQVHQAISQFVQGIQNRFAGSGNLSPARDLTGRWVDLQGEGLVVTPLAGPQRFHYDITMDITQNASTFTGTLWYRLWKVDALTSGYQPPTGPLPGPMYTVPVKNGVVSGPSIQFEAINGWIWKATFTTDRISGNFTVYDSGVTYRMVLNLNRQW